MVETREEMMAETIALLVAWLDFRVDYIWFDTIPGAMKYIKTSLRPQMFREHRQRLGKLSVEEYKFMDELFDNVTRIFIKTKFCKRWSVLSLL